MHNSANITSIDLNINPEIFASMERRLTELNPVKCGNKRKLFTAEQDEILRRYWNVRAKSEVSKVIGYSEGVCRARARELGVV